MPVPLNLRFLARRDDFSSAVGQTIGFRRLPSCLRRSRTVPQRGIRLRRFVAEAAEERLRADRGAADKRWVPPAGQLPHTAERNRQDQPDYRSRIRPDRSGGVNSALNPCGHINERLVYHVPLIAYVNQLVTDR